MKCDKCGTKIENHNERKHFDKILCEDCYMDILSPVRTCDPWATHSANSFKKNMSGRSALTPIQSEIVEILKRTGKADQLYLIESLRNKISSEELQRELSALHHMEIIGGERRGDQIIWQLWK